MTTRSEPRHVRRQSGQVLILVAVALLALIGSAALILLAGSVEWQKNQLQELADSAALDSALTTLDPTFTIGVGCDAIKAKAVITEADNFLATRRTRTGVLTNPAGACSTGYTSTDTFAGGITATINYPYRAQQQEVEVKLTLTLPISFSGEVGSASSTTVNRRAVARALPASLPAVSATTLTCAGGQVNVAGSIVTRNTIVRAGTCALYAHSRLSDALSGTYSDLGNVTVFTGGQSWIGAGPCVAGNSGSSSAICADGSEVTGQFPPTCGTAATSFRLAAETAINPNPCAAGTGSQPVQPPTTILSPDPNNDPIAWGTLRNAANGPLLANCVAATTYPDINDGGQKIGTGLGPPPTQDGNGYYHFKPSCYGYLSIKDLQNNKTAVLDPGFYYFNGHGGVGGLADGGICLGGKTLLARDVTIEFVNTADFSSNTCVAGGGANCGNPCQFGSDPAAAPADPPSNLTWFAAPCTSVPNPPDASCAASAWCTGGDRSCTNQLIWAPATATGQINLKGANNKAWLLGTVSWHGSGACTILINGTSTIAGALACTTLSLQGAAAPSGIAVGSNSGINTALAEAVLVE